MFTHNLALSPKDLLQVLFADEAFIVNIEVVECKPQILLGEGSLPVNSSCKELRVVDLALHVKTKPVEDLVYQFRVYESHLVVESEALLYLLYSDLATVGCVYEVEGVSERLEIDV